MPSLSPAILSFIAPFAILFSCPVWNNAITLFTGAILCRGKRTVCAALRVMGLSHETNFAKYHHVLNRVDRSLLSAAGILLKLLVSMIWRDKPLTKKKKRLKYISSVSLWGVDGFPPVPIRWVLVVDPEGELDPLPLMSTDLSISPEKIIALYIQRWNLEVTFEEVREHLGVETQRQWSDKAIARTTPILMSLCTIVCLIANRLHEERPIEIAQTAWYEKKDAAFSDLLKAVRKILWKDNLIFRKHILEPFHENNKGLDEIVEAEADITSAKMLWIRVLIEHLAAA